MNDVEGIEDVTPMRRWDDTPDRPDWGRDSVRMYSAIRATARLLAIHQQQNRDVRDRLNGHALRQGLGFDRRADGADGSAAAYGIALATLRGALRLASDDEMTGERTPDWWPTPMARPVLPDGIIPETPWHPDDDGDHSAFTHRDDDDQRGDHYAGMPDVTT